MSEENWYSEEGDGGPRGVLAIRNGRFYFYVDDDHCGSMAADTSRKIAAELLLPQEVIKDWIISLFGQAALEDTKERSLRFAEEALELVQATETSRKDLHRLVDYVYDRPPGDIEQEVGGVVVTLLGLAANLDLNVTAAFHKELKRILDPEMVEKMKAKQKAKAEKGIGTAYP